MSGLVAVLLAAQLGWSQAEPPMAAADPPPAAREWRYTVSAGDTLFTLAATYLDDPDGWPALQALNRIADPRRLVPGSTLRFPLAWLKREASVAEVVFVQGEVSLQRLGASERQPVAIGMPVRPADTLRTGAQSSVSLRFADGSRLLIVPDSQVSVEDMVVYGRTGLVGTRLRVDRGSADTRVQPNAPKAPAFEVRTPAMNLGVRGTDFRVRVDPDGVAARLEVLNGQVDAGPGAAPVLADEAGAAPPAAAASEAVAVGAGQGTVAQRDKPIAPPVALLPAPAVTAPPGTMAALALAWAPVDGAQGYRAQVFAEGRPDALLLDRGLQTPALDGRDDLPDGTYQLKLRAVDPAGLEGLDATLPIRFERRLPPPALDTPSPGEVLVGESVSIAWQPVDQARAYRLQWAAAGDFDAAGVVQDIDGAATRLRLAPGTYAWRTASVLGEGPGARVGPYGEPRWFDLRPEPPPATWEPPQFSPTTVLLRWRVDTAGQGVQLQIAQDPGFQQLVVDEPTWGAQWVWPRPPAGRYHLRLRSRLGNGPAGSAGEPMVIDVPGVSWWETWTADAETLPR